MRALIAATALALSLSACGSDGSTDSSRIRVDIKAGDTTCRVAETGFTAGDKVTFDVENTGKDVTEVYVYGKGSGGDFDKVVSEVENIAPGTRRDFTVTLTGGEYEVACKPGQKGDGIRTAIEVSGEAEETEAAYDREIDVEASDYAFEGLEGFTAKVGEKIEFKLENKSTAHQHEFEVLGPDGKDIGEVGPTDPGKDGEVILELKTAGTYTFLCGIADHADKGMKGTFTVS
jgi:plastocyanin